MTKAFKNPSVIKQLGALADLHLQPVDLAGSQFNPSDTDVDSSFGPYHLLHPIGMGGLGEVQAAFDVDLRRVVALKRVRSDRMSTTNIARLVEEAQITSQLAHPNIPAVHSLGVSDGEPFFSMTYVEGISLSDLLALRREDAEVAREWGLYRLLRVFQEVCYALAFAHDQGVIHRDIKPPNIMLGRFGEVRLMDWGIAKVLGAEKRARDTEDRPIEITSGRPESRFGTIVGTPGYISPEQVLGELEIDQRSDIYALGVLLFEILTGELPTKVGPTIDRLEATVAGRIKDIDAIASLPHGLSYIAKRAMKLERDERYQSVLDLIQDVEAFLKGRPVSAPDEGRLRRFGRFYVSRTSRSARLRFVDVDLLAGSSTLFGVAVGIWCAPFLASYAIVILLVAILLGIPFFYTWMRPSRPSDPLPDVPNDDKRGKALLTVTRTSDVSRGQAGPRSPQVDPEDPTLDADAVEYEVNGGNDRRSS